MALMKDTSKWIVKLWCNIASAMIPSIVRDIRDQHPFLQEMDFMVNSMKTNRNFTNYVHRTSKIWLDFDAISKDISNSFNHNTWKFEFKSPSWDWFTYHMMAKEYLDSLSWLARKAWYNVAEDFWSDLAIYNLVEDIKRSDWVKPNKRDLFNWIEIWNPLLIQKWLFWDADTYLLWDFRNMLTDTNWDNKFGRQFRWLKNTEPSKFQAVKDSYELVVDDRASLAKSITSAKSFAWAIFRFLNYTVNYTAWMALWVVQALSYENLARPFRWENMKKVFNIRTEMWILPENSLININQLLADAHSDDSFWFLLHNSLDKMTAFLDNYPKLKEYVMQTSWWLHQLVDLMYDSKIKNISFLRALRDNWIDWLKDLERLKHELTPWQFKQLTEDLKRSTLWYYEDMRWFPLSYWLNKVHWKFWAPFHYVFWFMSSWWLNVMKTVLNDTTLPIREALVHYWKTWDFTEASKLFMKWFQSEKFLYAMMTMSNAWLMWHRVSIVTWENQDDDHSTFWFIKHILLMSTYFNQSLQAFQSNIMWRVYMDWIDWLMYNTWPEWDATTFALFKWMQDLENNFFKEIRTVEPFIGGINSYKAALRSWSTPSEAETIAYQSIFRWFKKWMWWYVRYLTPTQESMDQYYWQHTDSSDALSFILWENVNAQKNKYFDLKSYESYLHIFKDSRWAANLVNYIIWNMPILKWAVKDDYYNYLWNFWWLVKELSSDDNLWKIRSTGAVPTYLQWATALQQEKWVNWLYNELTKWAPKRYNNIKWVNENTVYSNTEMKKLFQSAYKSLPMTEENIWTRKMMDILKNKWSYDAFLELYHSQDWTANENAYRWLVQIQWMLDAQSPWASRKFLSMLAYWTMTSLAKKKYWLSYPQLTPTEMLSLKQHILAKLNPLMWFHSDNWYVDYSYQTNAIQTYLKIMKPKLFATLASWWWDKSKSRYLNKWVSEYIALDTYTMNSLLSWNVDAYKIKNLFTKVWSSINDDDLKIAMVNKTLESIDKFKVDHDEKKAVETWILLWNLPLLDKLLKDKSFKDKYWTLADWLITRLWANNKSTINSWKEQIKAWNFDAAAKKSWHKINNPYTNWVRKRSAALHNKLRNYAKQNYWAMSWVWRWSNWSWVWYWGVQWIKYTPSLWTSSFRKPYMQKLAPAYSRWYRRWATSKDLIKGKKWQIRRTYRVNEWKIKPIRTSSK